MSHLEIKKYDQGPSLGLADSRDFTAVPWCPVCPFSKNLSGPGGPSSNPPPASTGCVALGQSTNLSEYLFSHLQKEFHNMYLTKWPWEFLFDLKYTEGKRLEAIVSGCSVQSLSRAWLFVTPWTAALQASLSITNSQSLLRLTSIESVMPSNHLILCRPLLLPSIFPSIRVFSNESVLHIRWPNFSHLEGQLQHQSFQWIFRTDLLSFFPQDDRILVNRSLFWMYYFFFLLLKYNLFIILCHFQVYCTVIFFSDYIPL